jgi:hypothetical protein
MKGQVSKIIHPKNAKMMKTTYLRSVAVIMSFVILAASFISCSSTTMIQTIPEGAKIYMNDEFKGYTPYKHTDQAITGTSTYMTFKMEGFEEFNTVLIKNETVDVGAVIGGIFFLFPFIWTMGYNPTHTYELIPEQF